MRRRVFWAMVVTALMAAVVPLVFLAVFTGARHFFAIALLCAVISFIIAGVVSKIFTRRVVKPINEIDFDGKGEVYEELLPLLHRVKSRKAEMLAQRASAEDRANQIAYITENMREGIILINGGGSVLLANKSVLRILGANEAAGRSVFELARDTEFIKAVKDALNNLEGDRLVPLDIGGRSYSVSISPTPPAGAVVLFIDITDKLSAERQRREFSANVSHELKTPLTTIIALAEMISNGAAMQGDVPSFADKIHNNAKRLSLVVEDVIRLSEFDEGRVSDDFAPFDLRTLADNVAESFALKSAASGVTLTVTGRRFSVSANRGMFDELIYNLVDNAVKYNKAGGYVNIEIGESGENYTIAVSDTGIGIPKEHLPRIFERFYRVDKSRSKETGGTGLGLSIVKHIAEFHNGRVNVESLEGQGTRVTCEFMK